MQLTGTFGSDGAYASSDFGRLDRLLRSQLFGQLRDLRHGYLVVEDGLGAATFGERSATLRVQVRVRDAAFYGTLARRGSVGAGEAYMAGHWDCDDLVALVRLLVLNRELLDGMEGGPARLAGWLLRGAHALRRNTFAGSRRNVAMHYDLGNEFFAQFLSADLMYSAAYWEDGAPDLAAASTRKLERICAALELGPQDHLLEIGSGWGALAVHAAVSHGCRVTTTTISREQQRLAQARVSAAGLDGRVTVLLQDYRKLTGQFDKVVSVEMIEAVGAHYQQAYFAQISRLLRPAGLALLQAITIEDHRYAQALRSVDFIKRHVFPGSFIPSVQAMLTAKTAASDLALLRLEDFGLSYARTLKAWREAFLTRLDTVRSLGFDERFIRMWEFYLAYCEGGFRERSIGVVHMLFARPGYRPRLAAGT